MPHCPAHFHNLHTCSLTAKLNAYYTVLFPEIFMKSSCDPVLYLLCCTLSSHGSCNPSATFFRTFKWHWNLNNESGTLAMQSWLIYSLHNVVYSTVCCGLYDILYVTHTLTTAPYTLCCILHSCSHSICSDVNYILLSAVKTLFGMSFSALI